MHVVVSGSFLWVLTRSAPSAGRTRLRPALLLWIRHIWFITLSHAVVTSLGDICRTLLPLIVAFLGAFIPGVCKFLVHTAHHVEAPPPSYSAHFSLPHPGSDALGLTPQRAGRRPQPCRIPEVRDSVRNVSVEIEVSA